MSLGYKHCISWIQAQYGPAEPKAELCALSQKPRKAQANYYLCLHCYSEIPKEARERVVLGNDFDVSDPRTGGPLFWLLVRAADSNCKGGQSKGQMMSQGAEMPEPVSGFTTNPL